MTAQVVPRENHSGAHNQSIGHELIYKRRPTKRCACVITARRQMQLDCSLSIRKHHLTYIPTFVWGIEPFSKKLLTPTTSCSCLLRCSLPTHFGSPLRTLLTCCWRRCPQTQKRPSLLASAAGCLNQASSTMTSSSCVSDHSAQIFSHNKIILRLLSEELASM